MNDYNSHFSYRGRFYLLVSASFLGLLLVLIKLAWIQGVHGEYYDHMANRQYEAQLKVPAERGEIIDCNGELLATNEPGLNILTCRTHYLKSEDRPRVINYFSEILHASKKFIAHRLDTSFVDVYVARGISNAQKT